MATTYILYDDVAPGLRISNDTKYSDYVIDTGVTLGSTDSGTIFLKNEYCDVRVLGTVSANNTAIQLGDDSSSDWGNTLYVAKTGTVIGNAAVDLIGESSLSNEGTIRANTYAIYVETAGSTYSNISNEGLISAGSLGIYASAEGSSSLTMVNRGVVSASGYGVFFAGTSGTTARVTNYGTIQGHNSAYYGLNGTDLFTNRGVVLGMVQLGAGNDLYDGRGGRVEGLVFGDYGDDLFFAGAEEETFDGSFGIDTLDFRSSGGLRVSLLDDSGTGRAAGDTYLNFERVLGSSQGADTLIGNDSGSILEGRGGDDSLLGGSGNDTLLGGADNDELFGGAGADTLDGGAGLDRLEGGKGGDIYVLATSGDTVVESSGAGTDQVHAGYSYTLDANLEHLALTGSANLNGTGNERANQLTGNSGVNSLSGRSGNDMLDGGEGKDSLRGGTGDDSFVFSNAAQAGDLIADFRNVSGNDDLFRISAAGFGGGLVAGTAPAATQFRTRADNLAQDSDDRFIFRTTDKSLWFDVDGKDGAAAVMLADLQADAIVTSADILLV